LGRRHLYQLTRRGGYGTSDEVKQMAVTPEGTSCHSEPILVGDFRHGCLLSSPVLATLEVMMGELVQDDEWCLPDELWGRLEPLLP